MSKKIMQHARSLRLSHLALLLVLLSSLFVTMPAAYAADWLAEEPEFLKVDQAFEFSTYTNDQGEMVARWVMPDGYYLYKHRFGFETRPDSSVVVGEPKIPAGKVKQDEFFGEVEVYYHEIEIPVAVSGGTNGVAEVGVNYQGCADAGLCYPPETRWVAVPVKASTSAGGGSPGGGASGSIGNDSGSLAAAPTVPQSSVAQGSVLESGAVQSAESALAAGLASNGILSSLFIFLVAGIALAFTPCVLPMVPILSSIIVGEADNMSRGRAFSLSLAYVLGMAITYAALGVVVGLFGASLNLQSALQSPAVLIFFAAVFAVLSLSMFGFYELQLPEGLRTRLDAMGQRTGGGKHLSVFVMGSLSALVVSPCVSAPLAGALIYLGSQGSPWLGGAALLSLGLGMGIPLLLIGASGGHLLPKAGAWMNGVKAVFGVLLLGVAIWLLERVVSPATTLALWAALAVGSGVYLGALDRSITQGWGQLFKAGGVFSLVYGVLLLIGAASGAVDPLRPLAPLASSGGGGTSVATAAEHWIAIDTMADLDAELQQASLDGQPAVLDFYADWCINCKVMERTVFPAPTVAPQLAQFRLLRLDMTANSKAHQELLQRFDLFGPPSLIFFAPNSGEISDFRIQGEKNTAQFADHLRRFLAYVGDSNIPGAVANAL